MRTEQAIEFLSQNTVLHIDMLEGILRGEVRLLDVSDDGVSMYHRSGETTMMSARNEEAAIRMISRMEAAKLIVAHQEFFLEPLKRKFSITETLECNQVAYLRTGSLPKASCPAFICQLDGRHLPFIIKHYSHATDSDYILDRLQANAMFGAYIKNDLVGFIGVHAEGSIGMLEVLPQYRRQGIAKALETHLVNDFLSHGEIPFAQIITGNAVSLTLHRQLGFSVSDHPIWWLW